MYVADPLSPERTNPPREAVPSTLTRPTTGVMSRAGLGGRLRLHRRRLIRSVIVGSAAAAATVFIFVLGPKTASTDVGHTPNPASAVAAGTEGSESVPDPLRSAPSTAPEAARSATVPADSRILALDRNTVRLPVSIDDRVEILGLTAAIESMHAEVVAEDATVIALSDDAVLVLVPISEAHRAAEVEAVGRLVVLGLSTPTLDSERP